MKERKSYERPAVVYESDLEALAADCGVGDNNLYLGAGNCKGSGVCAITFS